ncbi:MAG: M43 family zinc metalloprotease [Saprospiraceae bacterium]
MKKVLFYCFFLSVSTLFFTSCEQDENFAELTNQMAASEEGSVINAQTGERQHRCGSETHMEELLKNPEYLKLHESKFEKIKNVTLARSCASPTVLPVAVHFQGAGNADAACLRQLAVQQINTMNADFAGTNSDISIWNNTASNSFPGISNGEACLQFALATKNHPSGYGLSDGDLAVTVNRTNGDSDNSWSGYINIFVQFNTGVLGYAPLGGSGNGDGVVIDASAFGSGNGCGSIAPESPYNLGRTLTHEMGHYLLLDHIWGGGCGSDDGVADTPNSQSDYGGCPSIGESSCNSTDMHMNYMDYTNDACMYMFSAGQASRMESYVASSLSNIKNNASNVLGEGSGGGDNGGRDGGGDDTPTCNDGVQNGDETGVDCGGSNCGPCEEPTECTAPTSSQVEVINNTDVLISWNAIPDAIRYRIRFREVGTSQWLKKSTVNTQKRLNGLTSGATYEYQIRTRCSDNQWTPFNSKSTFTVGEDDNGGGGNNGDCYEITLELTLDEYGSETSWEVENEAGEIVAQGDNYADFQNGEVKIETFCLDEGCYTFYMDDAYGDGICCDYGDGEFVLKDADGAVWYESNGKFGTFEAVDFCIDAARIPQMKERRANAKLAKPLKTR